MTGRVRAYLGMSLDGRIAGPKGELDWLHEPRNRDASAPAPKAESHWIAYEDFMTSIGVLLMGRGTFDIVSDLDSWPYEVPVMVATESSTPHHLPERVSVASGTIDELVAEALAAAAGRDVYIDGGKLVSSALDAGLLDELTTTVLPTVRGRGIGLFDELSSSADLDLTRLSVGEGGAVQMTWEPHR